jgi:thiol-disulfide isomerase/thioredoxin
VRNPAFLDFRKRPVLFVFFFLSILFHAEVFSHATAPEGTDQEALSVTLFWREDCGHCKKEKEFLAGLQKEKPQLEIRGLDIDRPEVRKLFERLTDKYHLPKVTPVTVIGGKFLVGFDGAETTGNQIRELLKSEQTHMTVEQLSATDLSAGAEMGNVCPITGPSTSCEPGKTESFHLNIPLIGSVDPTRFTLPVLSVVLGLVDGFNPCAMWVLVAFLTALAQVGSMKRMIQFAGLFILAQGVMYFLILNSWFLAFDFIEADRIVTPIIGLIAIGGGIFFLWEFATFDGTCKVTNLEKRTHTLTRLQFLSRQSLTPFVVLGILGIALSVNVVEFACSIGIPQAFTKILDLNDVRLLEREALMGIYIVFYMLDDLVVFVVAIYSIERMGLTTQYSRITNFAGGVLLLILGVLLLVAPEKLRF